MFYHVIRRPLHSNTSNSSNKQRSGSISSAQLMPRYHYSRTVPNSATHPSADSFLIETNSNGHTLKPIMTTTTTTSNNTNNPYGSFKSTFIPFVANNRTITPTLREFIPIPITRENGTSVTTSNLNRSVPITYVSEANTLSTVANNNENNNNNNLQSTFTNLLRPSSRYFQHHFTNQIDEPTVTTATTPRVPSATRRLSLSIPVITTANVQDETKNQRPLVSPVRQIPIHFPQASSVVSTPTTSSRTSSAILRSTPLSHTLQRRRTDIGDASSSLSSSPTLVTVGNPQQSSSDLNMTSSNTLPIRRAEAMAREAIQNITQQQQQRNSLVFENTNNRSSSPSRRVIINLKNNQSVSLDSHLSAAMKLPPIPSSSRPLASRNHIYRIPILHELQMPPHPVSIVSEPCFQTTSASNNHNGNYKNEFHMEIPVTILTSNHDQENQIQQNYSKEDGFSNGERLRSTKNNTNQTLKSILKRSSSRDSVSRKNVSFMNA